MTVNDAYEKVKEAVEILSGIARNEALTREIVGELDFLCNDLLALYEAFDYIIDEKGA